MRHFRNSVCKSFRSSIISLSVLGMIMAGPLQAAQPPSDLGTAEQIVPTSQIVVSPKIRDVVLGQDGTFRARLISNSGQALAAQKVTVSRAGKHLITTDSTDEGSFGIKNLQGGLYRVDFDGQAAFVRLWTAHAAPPSAIPELLLVEQTPVQRAQCGCDVCEGVCDGSCGCDVCEDDYAAACDDGCAGPNPFCGILGNEPVMIGLLVAAAIAIPIAVHNSQADSDDAS